MTELREQAITAWIERGFSRHDIELAWERREGPFTDIDEDEPERPQVMPFPPPPVDQQTHNRDEFGRYADGSATPLDA